MLFVGVDFFNWEPLSQQEFLLAKMTASMVTHECKKKNQIAK